MRAGRGYIGGEWTLFAGANTQRSPPYVHFSFNPFWAIKKDWPPEADKGAMISMAIER